MSSRVFHCLPIVALTPFFVFAAAAQPPTTGDVTFEVPLNLTRIPTTITHVYLQCTIESFALGLRPGNTPGAATAMAELQPSFGNVVTTARVVVPVSLATVQGAAGQQASYTCMVWGHGPGSNGGSEVDDQFRANAPNPTFRMSPTPTITGNFVW